MVKRQEHRKIYAVGGAKVGGVGSGLGRGYHRKFLIFFV